MLISMLQPDRRTSTIVAMRRMSAWWSFSACDWRSTPMISRLGLACEWPVGEEQKEQKRKNIESKESKKNAVRVSGWWVWAFCSEEKQKEEQVKKKRERKKSREERKKKKKERKKSESDRWDVTMHWFLGPTIFTYLWTCHWVMVFEFWKQVLTIFIFHDCHPFFESPSNENHDLKLVQTNYHSWDPHDLDDGNRKLSDITQSSSHLNNL